MIAALNASSTELWLSKKGSLPPLPDGPCAWASSLSWRAMASNRSGFCFSRVHVATACVWAASQDGSSAGTEAAPFGSSFGRVQDVPDLDGVRPQVRCFLADVDLGHVALERRPGEVADDLGLKLVVEHVGGEDGPVLVEAHAVVDDLGLVRGVDRFGCDLGDAADPVGPVGALDDRGRRVDRCREDCLEEVRVDGRTGRSRPSRGRRPGARSRHRSRRSWRRPPMPCRSGGPSARRRPWPSRRPSGPWSARRCRGRRPA